MQTDASGNIYVDVYLHNAQETVDPLNTPTENSVPASTYLMCTCFRLESELEPVPSLLFYSPSSVFPHNGRLGPKPGQRPRHQPPTQAAVDSGRERFRPHRRRDQRRGQLHAPLSPSPPHASRPSSSGRSVHVRQPVDPIQLEGPSVAAVLLRAQEERVCMQRLLLFEHEQPPVQGLLRRHGRYERVLQRKSGRLLRPSRAASLLSPLPPSVPPSLPPQTPPVSPPPKNPPVSPPPYTEPRTPPASPPRSALPSVPTPALPPGSPPAPPDPGSSVSGRLGRHHLRGSRPRVQRHRGHPLRPPPRHGRPPGRLRPRRGGGGQPDPAVQLARAPDCPCQLGGGGRGRPAARQRRSRQQQRPRQREAHLHGPDQLAHHLHPPLVESARRQGRADKPGLRNLPRSRLAASAVPGREEGSIPFLSALVSALPSSALAAAPLASVDPSSPPSAPSPPNAPPSSPSPPLSPLSSLPSPTPPLSPPPSAPPPRPLCPLSLPLANPSAFLQLPRSEWSERAASGSSWPCYSYSERGPLPRLRVDSGLESATLNKSLHSHKRSPLERGAPSPSASSAKPSFLKAKGTIRGKTIPAVSQFCPLHTVGLLRPEATLGTNPR